MKLFEAFEALDALNEETFAVSDDGVEKLDTFMQDNEDSDDIVDVIDPEAETEEDIQDSYVGKVILDCSVCHSKIYKDKTEVTIDEEQQLANVGEDCPYCYTSDGFKVIGEVAPFADKNEDTVDVKEEEEEVVEESLTEAVGTLEKPMSAFAGTLSNVMTAHQSELASIGSKVEALTFLDSVEPEVKNKGYLATVKEKVAKLPDFKVLTFLYNIILKGDGMGSKLESLTESHRGDRHRVTAELFDILSENGFDTDAEDVEDYVFAARDLVFEEVLADPSKSIKEIVEQWFEDTKVNYPEDLEALTRFEEGLIPTPPMPNVGGLLEDGEKELDEFMDINLDARGFGGKDNNVSVLGGKLPSKITETRLKNESKSIRESADETQELALEEIEYAFEADEITQQQRDAAQNIRWRINGEDAPIFIDMIEIPLDEIKTVTYGSCKNTDFDGCYVVTLRNGTKKKYGWYDLDSTCSLHLIEEFKESTDESKSIREDINNLSLDTDDTHMEMTSDENGKVTITTEPIEKTNTSDEVIVPVNDETKAEIENNNVENEEDVDFEEFDEASFDELGESYLKESFDNVVAFRTNDVTMSGDDLIVEGLIKFDSGNVKKTSFTFTAKDFLKEGLYRFVGKNNQLVESNSFELVGKIKDTKFICESLTEIK